MNHGVPFSLIVLATLIPAGAQTPDQPVHKPGGDVSSPVLVRDVKPSHDPEAMREGIEGVVTLQCVVETDGTVSEVRVLESLDSRLDELAAAALKQWQFKPGMRAGKPVRVLIDVEMSFSQGLNVPPLDSFEVFKPGPGVTMPTVLKEVKPEYPASKRGSGIQGTVTLECVVRADGRVGDTRVTGRLDPDLDREAVRALRQWRFKPGERQGKPVPVQVNVEISFTLK